MEETTEKQRKDNEENGEIGGKSELKDFSGSKCGQQRMSDSLSN